MGYGLTDFYQTATTLGFARKNLFRIDSIGNNVYSKNQETNADLMLYLRSATIPSRAITQTSIDFRGFKFNVPMKAEYNEAQAGWSCEFFCDKEYQLREIFENWSVGTFDEHSQTSEAPNWWNTDVNLILLDNSTQDGMTPIRSYTLKGAFPKIIEGISYEPGDKGDIVTARVSLGFQYIIANNLT